MCVTEAAGPEGAPSLSPFILSSDFIWISIRLIVGVKKQTKKSHSVTKAIDAF